MQAQEIISKKKKRFTRYQTGRHTTESLCTSELTYTQLEKAKATASLCEDQIRSNTEHFRQLRRQIRQIWFRPQGTFEFADCSCLSPAASTHPTIPCRLNHILRIIKHLPKIKAPGHNNIRHIYLRNFPLNFDIHFTKNVYSAFHLHYLSQTRREANVISIAKSSKNGAFIRDRRSISLLNSVRKVIEKESTYRSSQQYHATFLTRSLPSYYYEIWHYNLSASQNELMTSSECR
jgi:hypothetical protein